MSKVISISDSIYDRLVPIATGFYCSEKVIQRLLDEVVSKSVTKPSMIFSPSESAFKEKLITDKRVNLPSQVRLRHIPISRQ